MYYYISIGMYTCIHDYNIYIYIYIYILINLSCHAL